ncbi:hypothetical protein BGZ94_004890, partial [Podila epigama]
MSFQSFVAQLAEHPHAASGVHQVTIEGWSNSDSGNNSKDNRKDNERRWSMEGLLNELLKLTHLQELIVRQSGLRRLVPTHNFTKSPSLTTPSSWLLLTRLDLRDCLELKDVSGIHDTMPQLQDLSLEGCMGLCDFRPLAEVGQGQGQGQGHGQGRRLLAPLKLKKLNLSRTKVGDQDLVRILRRSLHLEELRLDQCYDLTVASLVVIGQGQVSDPTTFLQEPRLPQESEQQLQGSQEPQQIQHSQETQLPQQQEQQQVFQLEERVEDAQHHPGPSLTLSTATYLSLPSSAQSMLLRNGTMRSSPYVPELKVLSVKNCCDFTDEGIRALVGCRQLELLIIRGLRSVDDHTIEWLHSQGVPLRRVLSPLGKWRYWHT